MDEYIPESQEVDMEALKKSPQFRKKRYVDAVFVGECVEMRRTGKGIMRYKTGRIYEGDWLNDLRHGHGYERYANFNVYFGSFETGKAHGQGHYTWHHTGEIYDGQWVRGVR